MKASTSKSMIEKIMCNKRAKVRSKALIQVYFTDWGTTWLLEFIILIYIFKKRKGKGDIKCDQPDPM